MSEKTDGILMLLKGFSFDGDTGRTISDLYAAVDGTGCTRDVPFIMPWWGEGYDRPAAANSYLDPDGRRVRIVWRSDESGTSQVVDVIFNAPSLAREKHHEEGDSCDTCSIEMLKQLSYGQIPEEDVDTKEEA